MIAFDAATGKKLWEMPNTAGASATIGRRPASTPTVEGDTLYAFGGSGDLSCVDAATGRRSVAVNVLQKFGGANRTGVAASRRWSWRSDPGQRRRPGASIVALNKTDGSLIWKSQGDDAGYSSPMPADSAACSR